MSSAPSQLDPPAPKPKPPDSGEFTIEHRLGWPAWVAALVGLFAVYFFAGWKLGFLWWRGWR